jgi:hypothetical protein
MVLKDYIMNLSVSSRAQVRGGVIQYCYREYEPSKTIEILLQTKKPYLESCE